MNRELGRIFESWSSFGCIQQFRKVSHKVKKLKVTWTKISVYYHLLMIIGSYEDRFVIYKFACRHYEVQYMTYHESVKPRKLFFLLRNFTFTVRSYYKNVLWQLLPSTLNVFTLSIRFLIISRFFESTDIHSHVSTAFEGYAGSKPSCYDRTLWRELRRRPQEGCQGVWQR